MYVCIYIVPPPRPACLAWCARAPMSPWGGWPVYTYISIYIYSYVCMYIYSYLRRGQLVSLGARELPCLQGAAGQYIHTYLYIYSYVCMYIYSYLRRGQLVSLGARELPRLHGAAGQPVDESLPREQRSGGRVELQLRARHLLVRLPFQPQGTVGGRQHAVERLLVLARAEELKGEGSDQWYVSWGDTPEMVVGLDIIYVHTYIYSGRATACSCPCRRAESGRIRKVLC